MGKQEPVLAGEWSHNAPSEAKESLKIRYTFTSPNEEDIKEEVAERRAKGARRVTEMKQNEREMQRKSREEALKKSTDEGIWS